MRTVIKYADPAPQMSTPSSHACPVNCGSAPTVTVNRYAAATETTNCAASRAVTGDFTTGSIAHG